MEQYETKQRLGLGSCGAVYLVRHIHSKKLFALKKIELDERRKMRTKEAVLKEASILSQLKHPHIVAFHDSFLHEDQNHICIIQDYCEGGTLADRIQEAGNTGKMLMEKQIMQWFVQVVMAVQYIHSQKVLHRDLKTENVFLTKKNVVKIGDFGISKLLDSTIDVARTVVGTPSYLSPEACQDIPYNSKSDIWALGCLLYELCALHPPFDGTSLISLFFKIIKAEFQPVPSRFSEGVHEIITKVLMKNPEDRPSASAILNMPFVKDHLATFIQETECLRQQRFASVSGTGNSSSDQSLEKSPFKLLTSRISNSPLTVKPLEMKPKHISPRERPSPRVEIIAATQDGDHSYQKDEKPDNGNSDYSDDFDESSDSEIEEDIHVEKEVSEDDLQYPDDFEEYDSSEELEEVLMQAREAQVLEPADDYFEEIIDENDDLTKTLTETAFVTTQLKEKIMMFEAKDEFTASGDN